VRRKRWRSSMQQSNELEPQSDCPLTHDLLNKISILVGNCELLAERTPQDSPLLEKILLIRDTGKAIAADLVQLESDLARLGDTDRPNAKGASL
jgi:hypothetical protein